MPERNNWLPDCHHIGQIFLNALSKTVKYSIYDFVLIRGMLKNGIMRWGFGRVRLSEPEPGGGGSSSGKQEGELAKANPSWPAENKRRLF